MENSSKREKSRPTFNPWNDAQTLTHVTSNVDRASDFVHTKIFNAPVMIPSRTYNRNPADIGSENYYNAADKASFDYLKTSNTIPSYSVNTMHLQNPYRPPQRLEGFASRDHTKVRLTFRKFPNKLNAVKRVLSMEDKTWTKRSKHLDISIIMRRVCIGHKISPWDRDITTIYSQRGNQPWIKSTIKKMRKQKGKGPFIKCQ